MKIIERIEKYLEKFEGFLVVLFLILMIVFSFLQVILRNFFHTGITWADVFTKHLVLWVGFLGAALATREERHINIEILTKFLSPQMKDVSKVIVNLFATFISILLLRASYIFIIMEKNESFGSVFLNLPRWIAEIIIPVGFLLITIHFVLKSVKSVLFLYEKSE